ncbi:DegV family protein [Sporosarcina sp. HYO08]|uniref:DegV family protein n=1 Tax=Sporosarcina sp. HYO08 TaxID=1759557 RepID=UPI0007989D67|nr:DegV family protein [Sporosarcina sp. HYO08]KXH83895.1 fatty acid-binding protein DegV [Sporosarcina sp. HYO08]
MTKKPLAWVLDSTAYIPESLKQHPDVYVVPLNIHFGEKQYVDSIDLSTAELYEKIKASKESPKTSQPAVGEFAELYKKLAENYEQAIAIHISSELSGTLSSSRAGADIANFPVTCIDSKALSYGMTKLVTDGIKMLETGSTITEIKEHLEKLAGTLHNYILIGSLDQLYKGGRMSSIQFYLGSLLKVKPIVQIMSDGRLQAIDKVRSEKRALQYLVDRVVESHHAGRKKIYLMHGNIFDKATHLKNLISEQIPDLEVEIGEIGSILAVHGGEGTLGILWFD